MKSLFQDSVESYLEGSERDVTFGHMIQSLLLSVRCQDLRYSLDRPADGPEIAFLSRILDRILAEERFRIQGVFFIISRLLSALNYFRHGRIDKPSYDLGCYDGGTSSLVFAERHDYGSDPLMPDGFQSPFHDVFIGGDAEHIALPDSSLATVVMNNVIYHVGNRSRVFGEVMRVLKPGGRLYFDDITSEFYDIRNRPFLNLLHAIGGHDVANAFLWGRSAAYGQASTANLLNVPTAAQSEALLAQAGFIQVTTRPYFSRALIRLAYAFHDIDHITHSGRSFSRYSDTQRAWLYDVLLGRIANDSGACGDGHGALFFAATKPA